VGQALEASELECTPLERTQCVDAAAHGRGIAGAFGNQFRAVRGIGQTVSSHGRGLVFRMATPIAHRVDRAVTTDRQHPGEHTAARWGVGIRQPPDPQVGFL
jgi:hypothetical protein